MWAVATWFLSKFPDTDLKCPSNLKECISSSGTLNKTNALYYLMAVGGSFWYIYSTATLYLQVMGWIYPTLENDSIRTAFLPIFFILTWLSVWKQASTLLRYLVDNSLSLSLPSRNLPDDPKAEWKVSLVSSLIAKHIRAHSFNMVRSLSSRAAAVFCHFLLTLYSPVVLRATPVSCFVFAICFGATALQLVNWVSPPPT